MQANCPRDLLEQCERGECVALLVSLIDNLDDHVRPAHARVLVREGAVAFLGADGDLLPKLREGHFGVPGAIGDELPAAHRAHLAEAVALRHYFLSIEKTYPYVSCWPPLMLSHLTGHTNGLGVLLSW